MACWAQPIPFPVVHVDTNHNFEAVWREMFIDSAAWAIVKPSSSTRRQSRCRPSTVSGALRCI